MPSSQGSSSSDGGGAGKKEPKVPQHKRKQPAGTGSATKKGRKELKSREDHPKPSERPSASSRRASFPSLPAEHPSVADIMRGEGMTFPEKLMDLLNSEVDKQSLWWLPDGKAFAIESKRFKNTILAQNFQGSKFESFTRKLARWGFKRNSGPEIPAHTFIFEHPYFVKSRPELVKSITGGTKKKDAPIFEEDRPSLMAPAARASLQSSSHHHNELREDSSMQQLREQQLQPQHSRQAEGATVADILGRPLEHAMSPSNADLEYSLRLQSDLDKQMLLHVMANQMNNSSEEHARQQQHHDYQQQQQQQQQQANLRTVTLLAAEQERSRILNAAVNNTAALTNSMSQRGSLASYANTASSSSATSQYVMDSTPLSNFYEQLSRATARPAAATRPSNSNTSALDPLLRLYLQQQQEATRRQNQRFEEEAIMQELIRREQQQRDTRPPPR